MGCTPSSTVSNGNKSAQPEVTTYRLGEHEIRLINKTWKLLSTDMTGYGTKVFLRIFQKNPKLKQLFPCRDVEGEELLKNKHFKGHASLFMQAIGAAVDNIDCLEENLAPLLLGLG